MLKWVIFISTITICYASLCFKPQCDRCNLPKLTVIQRAFDMCNNDSSLIPLNTTKVSIPDDFFATTCELTITCPSGLLMVATLLQCTLVNVPVTAVYQCDTLYANLNTTSVTIPGNTLIQYPTYIQCVQRKNVPCNNSLPSPSPIPLPSGAVIVPCTVTNTSVSNGTISYGPAPTNGGYLGFGYVYINGQPTIANANPLQLVCNGGTWEYNGVPVNSATCVQFICQNCTDPLPITTTPVMIIPNSTYQYVRSFTTSSSTDSTSGCPITSVTCQMDPTDTKSELVYYSTDKNQFCDYPNPSNTTAATDTFICAGDNEWMSTTSADNSTFVELACVSDGFIQCPAFLFPSSRSPSPGAESAICTMQINNQTSATLTNPTSYILGPDEMLGNGYILINGENETAPGNTMVQLTCDGKSGQWMYNETIVTDAFCEAYICKNCNDLPITTAPTVIRPNSTYQYVKNFQTYFSTDAITGCPLSSVTCYMDPTDTSSSLVYYSPSKGQFCDYPNPSNTTGAKDSFVCAGNDTWMSATSTDNSTFTELSCISNGFVQCPQPYTFPGSSRTPSPGAMAGTCTIQYSNQSSATIFNPTSGYTLDPGTVLGAMYILINGEPETPPPPATKDITCDGISGVWLYNGVPITDLLCEAYICQSCSSPLPITETPVMIAANTSAFQYLQTFTTSSSTNSTTGCQIVTATCNMNATADASSQLYYYSLDKNQYCDYPNPSNTTGATDSFICAGDDEWMSTTSADNSTFSELACISTAIFTCPTSFPLANVQDLIDIGFSSVPFVLDAAAGKISVNPPAPDPNSVWGNIIFRAGGFDQIVSSQTPSINIVCDSATGQWKLSNGSPITSVNTVIQSCPNCAALPISATTTTNIVYNTATQALRNFNITQVTDSFTGCSLDIVTCEFNTATDNSSLLWYYDSSPMMGSFYNKDLYVPSAAVTNFTCFDGQWYQSNDETSTDTDFEITELACISLLK